MELFYELLLTAAVTLLAAFLLATLFAANDPPRRDDRAAAAIAEAAAAEERIIEVDEVNLSEGRAAEAEGWVKVEKAPALVVEEEPECLPEEEGVPVKSSLGLRVGAGVEEQQEEGDAEKRCDLTPAAAVTGVVVEPNPHVLGAEVAPRGLPGVAGSEEGSVQDLEVKERDLGAEVAPIEVLDVESKKREVEAAELFSLESEDVEVKQHHLVAEVALAAGSIDAGSQEKSAQAVEVRSDELAPETASDEVLHVMSDKKEEQLVAVTEHESAVEDAPQPVLDVPFVEKEEVKDQQHVEEAASAHEEVQRKMETKCDTHPVDQQEELVPEEESVARKSDDVEFSHEGSSCDIPKAPIARKTELPVEVVTLQRLPEDDIEEDMDFGEWEGIERSEVEKRFGAAAAFAASEAGAVALSKLNSDVQLQLQGLLKVAIDGPCYDSTQPLTLRPSSRAKWVAWQKLGNMHPEIAMEKYMNLLSETIPGWMGTETLDTKNHEGVSFSAGPVVTMTARSDQQSNQGNEDSSTIDEGSLTTSSNPEKGQSSDTPAE